MAIVDLSPSDRQMPSSAVHGAGSKRGQIEEACRDRQLDKLREFASAEGGLINDQLRRLAWPLLLGTSLQESPAHTDREKEEHISKHGDEDQVHLDVDRSFVYYPAEDTDEKRTARKDELADVIITVLRHHPMLHYFQGFHDIAQVVLLVLGGAEAAIPVVARLSLLRIRDFMLPTMAGTEPHLRLLPVLLHVADPALARRLAHTQPFFALASTLTLYAHDIEDYADIARLFDFLLASEAVMSIYLFVAIIISRKSELDAIEADEPEMMHFVLSKLPKPLDLDGLISKAIALFHEHPPERLPGRTWARVSANSVLKTTRDFDALTSQTLEAGERYLANEAAEIQRQDARAQKQRQLFALARRFRTPALWTGSAVLFAVIAIVLRSTTIAATLPSGSWLSGLTTAWQTPFAKLWLGFNP